VSIRCFRHNDIEIRVIAHFKSKKLDMAVLSAISPIDRQTEAVAMHETVENAVIGMTLAQWLTYVPVWS
jgi:hypothetical protein